jgi:hypothetical protein
MGLQQMGSFPKFYQETLDFCPNQCALATLRTKKVAKEVNKQAGSQIPKTKPN